MLSWLVDHGMVTFSFYCAAFFFSLIFVVQMVLALIGMHGGDVGLDAHPSAADAHNAPSDASGASFVLFSVQSVLAFFTLFFWTSALFQSSGRSVPLSMIYGLCWGAVAMLGVAALVTALMKLAKAGNQNVASCVGRTGTVYIDIPAGGYGEVRLLCDGVMTHFKARAADPTVAIKAGTVVRIQSIVPPNEVTVHVDTPAPQPA